MAPPIDAFLASTQAFGGLIGQTLSADNASRRSAEETYAQVKRQRPDACATNLLQLLRTSPDPQVRTTCALYLRKVRRLLARLAPCKPVTGRPNSRPPSDS
jgi:hypothetical protein